MISVWPTSTALSASAIASGLANREMSAVTQVNPRLAALTEAGVSVWLDMIRRSLVTDELLVDGIKQFEDAMRRLLAGIEERREAVVLGRPPTIRATIPSELERPIAERVQRAVGENVAERVWRRDPSLWGRLGVPEIEDRLGWLTVSETMLEHAPELHAFARVPGRRVH